MDDGLGTATTGRAHSDAPVVGRLPVRVEECVLSDMEEAEAVHETHPADSDFRTHVLASDPDTENRILGRRNASFTGCGGGAGMNSTTTERQAMTPLPMSARSRSWPYGTP